MSIIKKSVVFFMSLIMVLTMFPLSRGFSFAEEEGADSVPPAVEQEATEGQQASDEVVSEPSPAAQEETKQEKQEQTEPTEPVKQSEDEIIEEESPEQSKTEYRYETDRLEVKAVLSDPEIIPDDAKLRVTPITDKSKGYNYDAYMQALNQDAEGIHNDDNTLLYDIAFIKDGKEIQPTGGTVSVAFDFKDGQLVDTLGAAKASDITVTHLPLKDKIRDKYDTTKAAKDIEGKDIEKEVINSKDLQVSLKRETVAFDLEDFSGVAFSVPDDSEEASDAEYKTIVKFVDINGEPIEVSNSDFSYYYVIMRQSGHAYVEQITPEGTSKAQISTDIFYGQNDESFGYDKVSTVDVYLANGKYNQGRIDTNQQYQNTINNWGNLNFYNKNDAIGGFMVDDITSTPGKTVITLKEKPVYTVNVNLVDYDGVTPYEKGIISGEYFVRVKATHKETGDVYYAVKPVTLNGTSSGTATFKYLIKLNDETSDNTRFNTKGNSDSASEKVEYDPALFTIERSDVRLISDSPIRSGSNENNRLNSDWSVFNADDLVKGFIFKSNVQDPETFTSTIVIRKCDTKYDVRFFFEPKGDDFTSEDAYYLFIEVDHQSSDDSYYLTKILINKNDLQMDYEDRLYYDVNIPNWQNGNGNDINDAFTGNEDKITLHILKAPKGTELNMTNVLNPDANNPKFSMLVEGESMKDYIFSFGARIKDENAEDKAVYYCDTVFLRERHFSDDFDYRSILGPGLSYGITADRFEMRNNDIQSNFATNFYAGNNCPVNPNLSGDSAGAIAIGNYVTFQDDKTLVIDDSNLAQFIDADGKVFIGETHQGAPLVLYTDSEGRVRHHRDFVYWVETSPAEVKDNIVDPIISHMRDMSNELMRHDADVEPMKLNNEVVIDATGFPDDATIYVDGDAIADQYNTFKNGTSDQLRIKKKENQTIVFNFKSSETLYFNEYRVDMIGEDGSVIYDNQTSKPDTAHGTAQNTLTDNLARHIVWNMGRATTTARFNTTAGIFLVQNERSDSRTYGNTSTGWVVTAGYFSNEGGEWHYVYADLTSVDKADLYAYKRVNGKAANKSQLFEFKFERWNNETNDFECLKDENNNDRIIINNGSVVSCEVSESNGGLKEGWNIFKISETGTEEDQGEYLDNTQVFYAAVNFKTIPTTGGDVKITSTPQYFKSFKAPASGQEATINDLSDPVDGGKSAFRNETEKGSLIIQKNLEGSEASNAKFKFEVTVAYKKEGTNISHPITGIYDAVITEEGKDDIQTIVQFRSGVANVVLKAGQQMLIKDLPADADYSVSEEDSEGFFLKEAVNDRGKISGETTEKAVFTNAATGELKVKKIVSSTNMSDYTTAFDLTVTLDDTSINGTYGDMKFKNGVAVVSLIDGESATASGLPIGMGYKVTEAEQPDFTVTKEGDEGTIRNELSEARITNSRIDEGSLTVAKTVKNGSGSDLTKKFKFKVKLGKISGTFGDVTFNNNVAVITTVKGKTITAKGLPNHINYTITTEDSSLKGKTFGAMDFDENGKCRIESTDGTIYLADNLPGGVKITITLDIFGKHGDMTFEDDGEGNAVATVFLAHGEVASAHDLPLGISYEVIETHEDGFTTTSTGETGEIHANSKAEFVNAKSDQDTGSLTVSKAVSGAPSSESNKEYEFTVKLKDSNPAQYVQEDGSLGGTAHKFKVKAGDANKVTISNIPHGDYVVEEDTASAAIDGYSLKATGGGDVTVSAQAATADLSNAYIQDTGSLTVNKAVSGAPSSESNKEYEFTVKLKDSNPAQYVQEDGSLGGTAHKFKVKAGDANKVTISNIPHGDYVVEEDTASAAIDGYSLKATGGGDVTVSAQAATADLSNAYTQDTGSLTVKKAWTGLDSTVLTDEQKVKLKFTITGPNNFRETFTYAEMSNGEKTISNLPVGEYTVAETGADQLDVNGVKYKETTYSVTGGKTAIAKDQTAEITVTNTYAVELENAGKTTNKVSGATSTGDDSNLLMLIAIMTLAALLALLTIMSWLRDRKEGEQE